ncbi:MAG: cytochrome b N-terminal domain-containing protein [Bacteroidales bacterium]|nr:cytochrome b N-terminal domain-containing protein [Bacteroidales bacterium]
MKIPDNIRRYIAFDTYGWVATASIILCAFSGALLAVPYDVASPYLSVTRFVTANPAASLLRNMHYWSAQLFLILTLIHIFDHLWKGTESNIKKKSVWFRLTLSLFFTVYVMLSGFILKADGDSLQAHRILSSLVCSLPWIGPMLQQTLIGSEGNFQVIYIQHAATATVILFVIIMEHARSLKVNLQTLLITAIIITLLSFLFRAPINGLNDSIMKGPWYFVGLQETLHWVSNPLLITLGLLLLLILIYLIPWVKPIYSRIIKQFFIVMIILYALLSITGFFFRGPMWQWQWPWENEYQMQPLLHSEKISFSSADTAQLIVIQGHAEGCVSCHKSMSGFSDAHKPEYIGCYSCHGGDPLTLDKAKAHSKMFPVPGNLSNASETCGNVGCHPGIVNRVNNSLMSTLSGIVSVDKWVFGETNDLNLASHINDLENTASGQHLRNLCAGCHLGNEKTKPGPAEWLERGGGCLACHLTYDKNALATLDQMKRRQKSDTALPMFHPALDLNITNDKCKSCHSRSGRISMNYEGWHETELKPESVKGKDNYQVLDDKRVFVKMPADIHHQKGMLCVDCHGSYELMGDGKHYAHKEDAVKVQCSDCHTSKANKQKLFAETDQETQLISWLRKFKTDGIQVILTQKGNIPLVNTVVEEQGMRLSMIKKSGNAIVLMKPPAKVCTEGKAHARLSCESCHTAWAPQCIGCHNSYESQTMGFDMLKNTTQKGTWIEHSTEGMAELPVLGINTTDKSRKNGIVSTFTPGMIMTIDKGSFKKGEKTVFHRLYAPSSAHTTQREGRSCKSCHNDPLAIGYGRGKLSYSFDGKWTFDPLYQNNKYDGLPEDSWTGFLQERKDQASTRIGMRPFNLAEQKRILTAGACLTCHDAASGVMKRSLVAFDKVIHERSKRCIMPVY